MTSSFLEVNEVSKRFPLKGGGMIHAVSDVSFSLEKGETLGIVGESGCGKSTLGRLILRLIEPSEGSVRFRGKEVTILPNDQLREMRRHMQMIFQDPFSSLDPRMRVAALIEEPLIIHGVGSREERAQEVEKLLRVVGLPDEAAKRYPHEFSGGQRQRICIARALALHPELIVADEPVSALDVSIQSQILNLMMTLKRERELSYIFVSHNLAVVKYVSDKVAVMYLGKIVEMAEAETLYADPKHPYTQALIAAIPEPQVEEERRGVALRGELPSPEKPPTGCHFHPRCPNTMERCKREVPATTTLEVNGNKRTVACHLYA